MSGEFGKSVARGLSEVTTENEGASPVTTGASDPSPKSAFLLLYLNYFYLFAIEFKIFPSLMPKQSLPNRRFI